MNPTELRRLLERRLTEILARGATIEIYDGDRLVFREVVDRAFRLDVRGHDKVSGRGHGEVSTPHVT